MSDYPLTTPEGKQYRILPSDDGNEIREYANGVIYDYTNKKPVKGLPLTPEIARSMQGRKHELAIEAASAGMLAAVESLSPDFVPGSGELGAWSIVVGKQTELALSPDAGHASTKAAEFIGRAADLLPDRRATATPSDGVTVAMSGAAAADMLRLVMAALDRDSGEVIDVTPSSD